MLEKLELGPDVSDPDDQNSGAPDTVPTEDASLFAKMQNASIAIGCMGYAAAFFLILLLFGMLCIVIIVLASMGVRDFGWVPATVGAIVAIFAGAGLAGLIIKELAKVAIAQAKIAKDREKLVDPDRTSSRRNEDGSPRV